MIHWLFHTLGLGDASGSWYLWWSGFGGDLPIFGAIALLVYHHNCHVKGCTRPGLHKVDGTPYMTCKKHHPMIDHTERVTADTIARARPR